MLREDATVRAAPRVAALAVVPEDEFSLAWVGRDFPVQTLQRWWGDSERVMRVRR